MIIQMYSLANIDEAVKCAELGVDHIGFAVGKDGIAPAELNYEEAAAMRKALPPQTVASALTVYDDVSKFCAWLSLSNRISCMYRQTWRSSPRQTA